MLHGKGLGTHTKGWRYIGLKRSAKRAMTVLESSRAKFSPALPELADGVCVADEECRLATYTVYYSGLMWDPTTLRMAVKTN